MLHLTRGLRRAGAGTCVWLACTLSPAARGSDLPAELQRYNRLTLSKSAQLYSPDDNETSAFRGYSFRCHRQADHLPAETPEAQAAFQRFAEMAGALGDTTADDRRRRLDLLDKAVAAGGWRAKYFDAMWGLWAEHNRPEGQRHFKTLLAMAEAGNPAALHGVLAWTNGLRDDMPQRISVLKAAIERGNPQVMSTVGFTLGTRTRELRPMALKMLECAAAQGDGSAYEGLGRIAWLEGRWVDAYRAWQQGANLGCRGCLNQMEDLVAAQPAHEPSQGTYGREPQVAALRKFYEEQFLYSMSHLIELRVPAPPALHIRWSDEQVVAVIKARIRRYGLP